MPAPLVTIHGKCDPRFTSVGDAFAKNFAEHGEVGGSLTLVVEGETVVDLWGGWADEARTRPWEWDTVVNVYSVTKGVVAVAAAMLADRGLLDYQSPVAAYWPEFGQAGKESIPVTYLLSHQAGLAWVEEELPDGAALDWEFMVHVFERQRPLWEPGTAQGYHAVSFGWLVGEVVRRITGRTVGEFVRDEIVEPLGVDFFIGLPASADGRTAELIPAFRAGKPPSDDPAPNSPVARSMALASARLAAPVNSRAWRAAELPGANGHANGRALARIYGALARGQIGGVQLLGPHAIDMATAEQVRGRDLVLDVEARRALGFILTTPGGRYEWGPNDRIFGHSGIGGSLGFADPVNRLGFGYAMNQMSPRSAVPRWKPMVDAVYRALGQGP